MYGVRDGEEDCAPDFRYAADRENKNYAHQYAKYFEKNAKESGYGSRAKKVEVSIDLPKEINYTNITHQTGKAILIDIDDKYKMWIPKSQIIALSEDVVYVTDYFFSIKELIKKV